MLILAEEKRSGCPTTQNVRKPSPAFDPSVASRDSERDCIPQAHVRSNIFYVFLTFSMTLDMKVTASRDRRGETRMKD